MSVPADTRAPTWRLCCLGDSVTVGYGCCVATLDEPPELVYWGYRPTLWDLLTSAGHQVSLVGRNADGWFPENRHEGYAGFTTARLQALVATTLGPLVPDLVVLMAGTNDLLQGLDPLPMLLSITTLLVEYPTPPTVLVSTVPPLYGFEAEVCAYNAAIPEQVVAVQQSYGRPVAFVDGCAGLTTADLADGIHPNAAAYERIGQQLAAAVSALLESDQTIGRWQR